jgi:hypothetical protein
MHPFDAAGFGENSVRQHEHDLSRAIAALTPLPVPSSNTPNGAEYIRTNHSAALSTSLMPMNSLHSGGQRTKTSYENNHVQRLQENAFRIAQSVKDCSDQVHQLYTFVQAITGTFIVTVKSCMYF